MKYLLMALGLVGVIAVLAVLNGWVVSVLWGWFIVPLFSLPTLSIVQAIGLGMVVSYMTQPINFDQEEGELTKKILTIFLRPPFVVGIGYIVLQFM